MAMKWVLLLLFVINFSYFVHALDSVAYVSTSWIIDTFIPDTNFKFDDGIIITPVLLRDNNTSDSPSFGCGFYRNQSNDFYFFVAFAVLASSRQILWTANRANPVTRYAVLDFSKDGVLTLFDNDGQYHRMLVWSSYTSGMSVKQMKITANGSLVLSTSNELETPDSSIIWQSWDQPTMDALLPGQMLVPGQRLIASASSSDLTASPYYLSFVDNDLSAFIESNPPQMYLNVINKSSEYFQFNTGSLKVISTAKYPIAVQYMSYTGDFLRLDTDGHLRVYLWTQWKIQPIDDILSNDTCIYPTVCENYGICRNSTCSCPEGYDMNTRYFMEFISGLGCIRVTQLTCQNSHLHSFIELKEVSYSSFVTDLPNIDQESCKEACLKNCSCRAALFQYNMGTSYGNCSLPSQVFSLMRAPQGVVPYNSISFIKVQNLSVTSTPSKESFSIKLIVGSIFAALVFEVLLIWISVRVIRKREQGRLNNVDEEWENSLSLVPNLPTRFSYKDLVSATDNFNEKLGGGGFGSVYEGTLSDGTKIAVKRL